MNSYDRLIRLAPAAVFACALVFVVGCCHPATSETRRINTVHPEHVRLRKMLVDLPSTFDFDEGEIKLLLEKWFRSLKPEDRVEVVRESLHAASRVFTEYRPALAWITNVIEEIHTLEANEVAEILKHPEFEESGPPLGLFFLGFKRGITGAQDQKQGEDKSGTFAMAVLMVASGMPDAGWAFRNPEGWKAFRTFQRLTNEWMEAGQKPEDPLLREIRKVGKEVKKDTWDNDDEEMLDWIRQVVEPIVRRIDGGIGCAGPSSMQ